LIPGLPRLHSHLHGPLSREPLLYLLAYSSRLPFTCGDTHGTKRTPQGECSESLPLAKDRPYQDLKPHRMTGAAEG
jgi:hypothetical protein